MIYLDNAATTYPKPASVLRRLRYCLTHCTGNPGRSAHLPALRAAEEIYGAREEIANLLHFPHPEQVVFTLNATYALNLAIKAYIKPGMHVLISPFEHNSVVRPLEKCRDMGVSWSCFSTENGMEAGIDAAIRPEVGLIVCSLCSNVTGMSIPLPALSAVRAAHPGVRVIADASQAFGHTDLDLSRYPVDVLCAPGHKGAFGIAGSGFAVFLDSGGIETLVEGGSGNNSQSRSMPQELPERLEAGTLPLPAIATLGEGVRYLARTGICNIEKHTATLCARLRDGLSEMKGVRILYPSHSGVLSFVHAGVSPARIAARLAEENICVRSGVHCSPLAHAACGTLPAGAVRLSLSCFNTRKETDVVLKKIAEILRTEP